MQGREPGLVSGKSVGEQGRPGDLPERAEHAWSPCCPAGPLIDQGRQLHYPIWSDAEPSSPLPVL